MLCIGRLVDQEVDQEEESLMKKRNLEVCKIALPKEGNWLLMGFQTEI